MVDLPEPDGPKIAVNSPFFISKLISEYEDHIRLIRPFNLFGWFEIVYGQKSK